jgi:transposase
MEKVYYIGLDVHKDSIDMAVFEGNCKLAIARKRLGGDPKRLVKEISVYQEMGRVQVAYEAGCLGYTIYHALNDKGIDCRIIPPNKVFRPGNTKRIKNDKTDAGLIANMLQYGKGESINVLSRDDEATRDLLRCREDLLDNLKRTKQRLLKFLLRHGRDDFDGKTNWTKKHFKWLGGQRFELANEQLAFEHYLSSVESMAAQLERIDMAVIKVAESEPYREQVQRLRAFNGIDYIIALSFVCEVGDFRRFGTAAQFMSYLGLVPSESSSGNKRHQGAITKTGNGHLRVLAIEAAWHYASPNDRPGKRLTERRKGMDEKIIAVADKAHKRLHKKYARIVLRQKPHNVAATAVARELCGFIWSVMNVAV